MKLKVGDRVRYVVQRDIDNVKVGEVGIIRGISPNGSYAVDFEESGYKHNCDGLCQSNHGWWCSGDTLEPVDSKTLRMADGTIIGEFNSDGGLVSIHDVGTHELWTTPFMIPKDRLDALVDAWAKLGCTTFNLMSDEVKEVIKKTEEKKMPTKFTFYTEEGYRIDKSNNSKVETITTFVKINGFDNTYLGMATCDKVDYSEREGVINALANAMCNGNFDREFNKAVKDNARADKKKRTCTYCGQLFDTVEEKQAHEAWHVERRKARHERYLLRKRAKEIAFEEQAQKMAKEIIAEDNKK